MASPRTGQHEATFPAPIQTPPPPPPPTSHPEDAPLSTGQNITPTTLLPPQSHTEDYPPPPPPPPNPPLLPLLHTTAHLTLFSILGTLSRLGLTTLTTFPASPISGVIWAQFAGSALMGLFTEGLRDSAPAPLYIGLTTGFCGSLTSFSSFELVMFELLSTAVPGRAGGYGVASALGYGVGTLCLSFSGLQFGAQVAVGLRLAKMRVRVRVLPPKAQAQALSWAAVVVALGMWAGAAALAGQRRVGWAYVFAPVGTLGRFWVGRWLNRGGSFPVGTFVVNMLGTGVLAGLAVGRYELVGGGGCAVLRGVGDGFCGCLTTVSTFVVEVRGLRLKHAYFYAATSIVVGFCLMLLILGSYTWTQHVSTSNLQC